jgi:hypothetical protein
MRIERLRPTTFQVTLHAYELSALVAGARWAAENGEFPDEAAEQLESVLSQYEAELQKLEESPVESS